jgi:hypothetical protein
VDGSPSPQVFAAIEHYQRRHGLLPIDGRVRPSGATLHHLLKGMLTALAGGVARPYPRGTAAGPTKLATIWSRLPEALAGLGC